MYDLLQMCLFQLCLIHICSSIHHHHSIQPNSLRCLLQSPGYPVRLFSVFIMLYSSFSNTSHSFRNKAENPAPVIVQRVLERRDRSADEKNRQVKEKVMEYWRSIVPSSCTLGLAELEIDEVIDEIQRRVRREAKNLCLFPSENFIEPNSEGGLSKQKRINEWLICATNLVFHSLNLDSPNPIGWDDYEDSFVLSKLQSGEVAPSYWILGAFCRLRGAQPWQATRSYIVNKVYEHLEAEGWEHWITSQSRWDALGFASKPVIVKHLQDLNSDFKLTGNSDLLDQYASKIWSKFVDDHLKILSKQAAALVPLYILTEGYVKLVGSKIENQGDLKGSTLLSSSLTPPKMMLSELDLKSSVMKRVKKLKYEYFPLIQDSEGAIEEVRDKVLERLQAMSRVIRPEDLTNSKLVASILNDLEDQSDYLSTINNLFRVRVCLSDIVDSSVTSLDASSFLHGSRSIPSNESNSRTKRSLESSNKTTKRSISPNDSSSSERLSKMSKFGSNTRESNDAAAVKVLTLSELREATCGNCTLCSMPDCKQCFACVENESSPDNVALKCCIRKMCCKIPTQIKVQEATDLGLPSKWRFTFDDPQICNVVLSERIISPLGMKIISPDGKQYHSLQSTFSHVPHSSAQDAIQLVETFLKALGSRYSSCPDEFLVGKDYCIDFSINERGSRVIMFGKIVACMKNKISPSMEVSNGDSVFFILQYTQDTLDAAKRMGIHVPPLQLITAATAWGGCIGFERKTMCRSPANGVVAKIDQATPVSHKLYFPSELPCFNYMTYIILVLRLKLGWLLMCNGKRW